MSLLHAPRLATASKLGSFIAVAVLLVGDPSARATEHPGSPAAVTKAEALSSYGRLPLSFIRNAGQENSRIRYYAYGRNLSASFSPAGAMLAFLRGHRGFALQLAFLGARQDLEPVGNDKTAAKVNYLLGRNRAKWRTGLPTFARIVYRNVWPGIDVAFRGAAGRLEYELLVRPGADVSDIRLTYRGAQGVAVDARGNLILRTAIGRVTDTRPVSYQVFHGKRIGVTSRFAIGVRRTYGFALGRYDARRPLVIDPGLVYSTYLGGSGTDSGTGITVDAASNAYVTGLTNSSGTFPTTPGAYDTSYNGGANDVFVTKLNPAGTSLVYSTYIGGSLDDQGKAIAVDALGDAYITGLTTSMNFPTAAALPPPSEASDTSANGGEDAFVAKLNPTGSNLVYSTYLGGSGRDNGTGISVNPNGEAYVTGFTGSLHFPFTPAALDSTLNGNFDAFLTVVDRFGTGFAYSSYLGGNGDDMGRALATDATGDAFITGQTTGSFPTTPGAFDTTANGLEDGFVMRLNFTGSGLSGDVFVMLYSTYVGGSGTDRGLAVAIDSAGNAYINGLTNSGNFPTTVGAYDRTFNGNIDAYATKLNPPGTSLVYSSYLGGTGDDRGGGIAVDPSGAAYLTGRTNSSNFPTTAGAQDTTANGSDDVFVTKLDLSGANPVYSTYLGGSSSDQGQAIALDATGATYVTGLTSSANFPTTSGAYDTSYNGSQDAFVTKLLTVGAPSRLVLTPPTATNTVGDQHCVTATVTDVGNQPVSGVTVRFSVPTSVATDATPASGSATTDANGQAMFCYTALLPGEDLIHAYADTNNNGVQDAGEPFGDATKTWVVPGSTAFCEVTVTDGGWINALNGDRANFGGNAKVSSDGAAIQGQQQYTDQGPVAPMSLHSTELTATTCSEDLHSATIFGRATIDGSGDYVFRIDVTDNDKDDTYGIIVSNGYGSGQQPLQGGNVTIHKT
jgi:hypothetical protein